VTAHLHVSGAVGTAALLLRCSLWPLASRLGCLLVASLASTRRQQVDYVAAGCLGLLREHLALGHITVGAMGSATGRKRGSGGSFRAAATHSPRAFRSPVAQQVKPAARLAVTALANTLEPLPVRGGEEGDGDDRDDGTVGGSGVSGKRVALSGEDMEVFMAGWTTHTVQLQFDHLRTYSS
jgi:hypothetical protein